VKKVTQEIFERMTQKYLERSKPQFAGFLDFIKEEHPELYELVKEEFTFFEAKNSPDYHPYTLILESLWQEYIKGGDTGD
jgi:hypothetical protein